MRNICSSPNYVSGRLKIQLSVSLKGTMAIGRFNLMPRSGLEPTVRFDICESAPFTVIKAIYGIWNNNWIQVLPSNASKASLRSIDESTTVVGTGRRTDASRGLKRERR